MLTAQQAWNQVKSFLGKDGVKYAPETIADCRNCFVFSIRLKTDPPGASTGMNPYIVYKATGKVINDTKLDLVSSMKPVQMISPNNIK